MILSYWEKKKEVLLNGGVEQQKRAITHKHKPKEKEAKERKKTLKTKDENDNAKSSTLLDACIN